MMTMMTLTTNATSRDVLLFALLVTISIVVLWPVSIALALSVIVFVLLPAAPHPDKDAELRRAVTKSFQMIDAAVLQDTRDTLHALQAWVAMIEREGAETMNDAERDYKALEAYLASVPALDDNDSAGNTNVFSFAFHPVHCPYCGCAEHTVSVSTAWPKFPYAPIIHTCTRCGGAYFWGYQALGGRR